MLLSEAHEDFTVYSATAFDYERKMTLSVVLSTLLWRALLATAFHYARITAQLSLQRLLHNFCKKRMMPTLSE